MKKQGYSHIPSILVLILGICLWSCDSSKKAFNSGVRKFNNGEYNLAIREFNKAVEAQYQVNEAHRYIAESYRLSNRFREAIPYFEKVLEDRKSTRLNSSHVKISYAVFCLKKKKNKIKSTSKGAHN